jgi:Tfp pilus assembly protein PilX
MKRAPYTPRPAPQRGAAALLATLLLFFAMVLGALFVNRNLVFEQRASANQYRSTQAFEAAEAGVEWALAALNTSAQIGADCKPTDAEGAASFRARYLAYQPAGASYMPVLNAGTALRPACVRDAQGWRCSCPAQGAAALTEPSGAAPAPAFAIQFAAGPKAGTLRLTATGCSRLASPCTAGANNADAQARIDVVIALLPGLRTPPGAALTARGSVDAGSAALGLHNADPATGLAIAAGGSISGSQLRLTPPAGSSIALSTAPNDPALAAQTSATLFATTFGVTQDQWKRQPVVERIACGGSSCNDALAAPTGGDAVRQIWLDGDLRLAGPLTLGSPARPIVLVASGDVHLEGDIAIHGLVYGRSLRWDATSTHGALLRGAVIVEGDYAGSGTPNIVYDTQILAALRGNSGSFVRLPGGWRDF